MLQHLVIVSFKEGVSDDDIDAAVEGLRSLPAAIPEIRSLEVGRDLGLSPGTSDLGLLGSFDSLEDLQTYLTHPAHLALIREHLAQIVERIDAVQFER